MAVRDEYEAIGEFEDRLEFARSVLSSSALEEGVEAFVQVARELPADYEREFIVHCLRYYVPNRAERFLSDVLTSDRWSVRERALALEGLLPIRGEELLRWGLAQQEPDVVETAILNADWRAYPTELLVALRADERRGPTTGDSLGELAVRMIEEHSSS